VNTETLKSEDRFHQYVKPRFHP